MKNHLRQAAEQYSFGILPSYALIQKYIDVLTSLGTEKKLQELYDAACQPLADYLYNIIKCDGHTAYTIDNYEVTDEKINEMFIADVHTTEE